MSADIRVLSIGDDWLIVGPSAEPEGGTSAFRLSKLASMNDTVRGGCWVSLVDSADHVRLACAVTDILDAIAPADEPAEPALPLTEEQQRAAEAERLARLEAVKYRSAG